MNSQTAVSEDVTLTSGRVVRHFRANNGSQDAIPTTGPEELTDEEWQEYAQTIRDRSRLQARTKRRAVPFAWGHA